MDFREAITAAIQKDDEAVIVQFPYGYVDLSPIQEFESELHLPAIVGEYDGYDLTGDYSEGRFYFYGESANELFDYLKPYIETFSFLDDAVVTLRFGGVGAREEKIRM